LLSSLTLSAMLRRNRIAGLWPFGAKLSAFGGPQREIANRVHSR
jgi:hypothetical protein